MATAQLDEGTEALSLRHATEAHRRTLGEVDLHPGAGWDQPTYDPGSGGWAAAGKTLLLGLRCHVRRCCENRV